MRRVSVRRWFVLFRFGFFFFFLLLHCLLLFLSFVSRVHGGARPDAIFVETRERLRRVRKKRIFYLSFNFFSTFLSRRRALFSEVFFRALRRSFPSVMRPDMRRRE